MCTKSTNLALAAMLLLVATPAIADQLFAHRTGISGELYLIDPAAQDSSLVGGFPDRNGPEMEFSPDGSVIYFMNRDGALLLSVDPGTAATVSSVALSNFPGATNTLSALEFVDGTLYGTAVEIGARSSSPYLVMVDTTTGVLSDLGQLQSVGQPAGGMDYFNDQMYLVSSTDTDDNQLFSVDLHSATATLIAPITLATVPQRSISALASADGVMYVMKSGDGTLYGLNTSTGALTTAFDTGRSINSLAARPINDSQPVTFETSIDFSNDGSGSVSVELNCNTGLPLNQQIEISEGDGVIFTVTDLPYGTSGTACQITASDASGYVLSASANGQTASESCVFNYYSFSYDGANECVFTATPAPAAITVNTDFEWVPDDIPESDVDTSFETVITCQDASLTNGSDFGEVQLTVDTDDYEGEWYANPDGGADCSVTLYPDSSAVEGDSCTFSFGVGDEEAGCDVIGTVFFEGVPAIGRRGLALMALLVLGIGLVGMRRFA